MSFLSATLATCGTHPVTWPEPALSRGHARRLTLMSAANSPDVWGSRNLGQEKSRWAGLPGSASPCQDTKLGEPHPRPPASRDLSFSLAVPDGIQQLARHLISRVRIVHPCGGFRRLGGFHAFGGCAAFRGGLRPISGAGRDHLIRYKFFRM